MNYFWKFLCKLLIRFSRTWLLIAGVLFLFSSCEDIFEEDISNKDIIIIAPADSLETEILSHTFWWEELDGASQYNLQIVSPSFSAIEKLVLDTTITNYQFLVQLYPDDFEWRVRGMNSATETEYTTYSLHIDSTADLSSQTVLLMTPGADDALSDKAVSFNWDALPQAEEYMIRIKEQNWEGDDITSPVTISETNFDFDFEKEGRYAWGVMAINESSSTRYSSRKLIIDQTNPDRPQLEAPADNASFTEDLIQFSWEQLYDDGAEIFDSLLVSTDSLFTSENLVVEKKLDESPYSYSFTGNGTVTYYWKLSAFDAAGNWSGYTNHRQFTIEYEK